MEDSMEIPYDPAIPLLGIYPGETKIENDTCTPMFTAALFAIAKTWKQPRCPSTDEWIKKLGFISTMGYYSAIKRNTFESVLMRWMNTAHYTEWSKSEMYISCTDAYMWNLERWYWWIYLQGSNGETDIKSRQTCGYGDGRREWVRCMEKITWKLTIPYVK